MKLEKTCKRFALVATILPLTVLGGWIAFKQSVIILADNKAQAILTGILKETELNEDQKVIAITVGVFQNFHEENPENIFLLRLRPYVTNYRLPSFLRMPDGALETLIQKGYCDNAARMLGFLLKQRGLKSVQWNMTLAEGAHSALLVFLSDGRRALLDPFYGYVTVDAKGRLIDPEQAKKFIQQDRPFRKVFLPLSEHSKPDFYKSFGRVTMAAQDAPIFLESTIPTLNNQTITLGKIDEDSTDVRSDSTKHGMNPYWNYFGHKYNRKRTRVLIAREPVKVTMILVASPGNIVAIATPIPEVDHNRLTWTLKSGEKIIFNDGFAKLSYWRMNSYIDIDQIIFSPLGN